MTVPLGTGIIYAGMNDARVNDNYIFDNWRYGSMLFAVPDALTSGGGAEGNVNPGISCPGAPDNGISTSCGNQFFANDMGRAPTGFNFPACGDPVRQRPLVRRRTPSQRNRLLVGRVRRQHRKLLVQQHRPRRDRGQRHRAGDGDAARTALPSNCNTSVGGGDSAKEAYLIECSNGPDNDTGPTDCDWWRPAPRPTSASAQRAGAERKQAFRAYAHTQQAHDLLDRMKDFAGVEGRP